MSIEAKRIIERPIMNANKGLAWWADASESLEGISGNAVAVSRAEVAVAVDNTVELSMQRGQALGGDGRRRNER